LKKKSNASVKKVVTTKGQELVVKVKPGIVAVLPASRGYFNHLKIEGSADFEAKSSGGINIYRMGTNLLITFLDPSHPADLAIRDKNTDDIYLLALMPDAIPPRTYTIILTPKAGIKKKDKRPIKNGTTKTPEENRLETAEVKEIKEFSPIFPLARPEGYEESYEEFLLDILSKAALSEKLQNASLQDPWPDLEIRYEFDPLNGLTLYSVKRWLISDYEVDLFLAKNEGGRTITLPEPYLWHKGVLAIAFIY